MYKQKKKNLFFMFSLILFALVLFSSMITSGILARYTGNNGNNDEAKVAKFYVDGTNSEEILTLDLTNSSSVVFIVEIVNFNGDTICETAVNYGFTISTLDNLPLKISISEQTKKGSGNLGIVSGTSCTNGYMGVNSKETHSYTITVSWDTSIDDWNDYENSKKVDIVIINFNATQID